MRIKETVKRALVPGYGAISDYKKAKNSGASIKDAVIQTAATPILTNPVSSKTQQGLNKYAKESHKMKEGQNKAIKVFKELINDEKWYTRFGAPTPARNINRPTNPIYVKDVTHDPAMGGMSKHSEIACDWDSLSGSQAFETATFKLMEMIRNELKSNLPYSLNKLRAYVHNTLSLSIYLKQIERQLRFTKFVDPDDPNFNRLWNKVNATPDANGFNSLITLLPYVSEANGGSLSDTIAMYDVAMRVAETVLKLPGYLPEFVDHYAGQLFMDSNDLRNTQFMNLRFRYIPFMEYDQSNDRNTVTYHNIIQLDIRDFVDRLNAHMNNFSIVNADATKTGQLRPIRVQYYSDLIPTPAFDQSFIQAMLNGYTDNGAITEDGYIKMDQWDESQDMYTQFLFAGAIQPNLESTIGSPLIKLISQSIKFISDADLVWPDQLFQNGVIDTTRDFAITISSTLQTGTTVSVNVSDANYITTQNPTPGLRLSANGITSVNDAKVSYTVNGNYLGIMNGIDDLSTSTKIVNVFVPVATVKESSKLDTESVVTTTSRVFIGWRIERVNTGSDWTEDSEITVTPLTNQYIIKYTNGDNIPSNYTRIAVIGELSTTATSFRYWHGNDNFYDTPFGASGKLDSGDISILSLGDESVNLPVNSLELSYPEFGDDYNLGFKITLSTDNILNLEYPVQQAMNVLNTTYSIALLSNNTGYTIDGVHANFINMTATLAGTLGNLDSVSHSMNLLPAYFADQVDYHIPFTLVNNTTINVNGVGATVRSEKILVKENYTPYFYNVADLVPLSYSMIYSLMAPGQ